MFLFLQREEAFSFSVYQAIVYISRTHQQLCTTWAEGYYNDQSEW